MNQAEPAGRTRDEWQVQPVQKIQIVERNFQQAIIREER